MSETRRVPNANELSAFGISTETRAALNDAVQDADVRPALQRAARDMGQTHLVELKDGACWNGDFWGSVLAIAVDREDEDKETLLYDPDGDEFLIMSTAEFIEQWHEDNEGADLDDEYDDGDDLFGSDDEKEDE